MEVSFCRISIEGRLSLIPNEQIAFPINGHHAVSKIALILESTRSLGPKANFAKKMHFSMFFSQTCFFWY